MYRSFGYVLVAMIVSLLPATASAASFISGEQIRSTDPIVGDAILSGTSILITAPVNGELFAAGQDIALDSTPGRSALLIGKTVNSSAGSSYDLFAVGQTVHISGSYRNDVYLAGNSVVVEPNTTISGSLYVFGASVVLAGKVSGNVYAKVSTLHLNHTDITGAFNYSASTEASGLTGSHIGMVRFREPTPPANNPLGWLIPFFATVLTAGLLLLTAPKAVRAATDTLRHRYWRSLGLGYATILLTPLLIISLFISMIGYQLALLTLCLYVALLTLGGILGALTAGRLLTLRFLPAFADHPWLVSLIGSLAIFTLSNLPGLGLSIGLLVYPAAIGAAILSLRRRA